MTSRKPPNVSFPSWVEHQIRQAQAAGAFENLRGAGKPIPDIDRPQHELAWVAGYLRRENVDVGDVLPPALALAKEVETLPQRLQRERSEPRVRKLVQDLNERIARAHAQPQVGPPLRVRAVDVEAAVTQWRAVRAAAAADPPASPPPPAPARRRRRWLRRTS
jgi:pyruvate/2-oxoglutarate dehydrogenase complex dihydrolipoamide acyltransferase (E2) component